MGAGGRRSSLNSSRSEFLAADAIDSNITYPRSGCFVSAKKFLFFGIIIISLMAAIGYAMYYYGSLRAANTNEETESDDIEEILNNNMKTYDSLHTSLPTKIIPQYYRLKIQPYINENGTNHFKFTGHVTIVIQANEATKFIVLNTENLVIDEDSVQVSTSQTHKHRVRSVENTEEPRTTPATSTSTTRSLNVSRPSSTELPTSTSKKLYGVLTTSSSSANNSSAGTKNSSSTETTVTKTSPSTTTTLRSGPLKTTASPVSTVKVEEITSSTSRSIPNTTISSASTKSGTSTTQEPTKSPATDESQIADIYQEQIVSQQFDPATSKYTINLLYSLEPGVNYTVSIPFSGNVSEDYLGLYKTYYKDATGRDRWLVSTNLQPIYARTVFPCFDEPSFKSEFEISVARRTNMTALSNMPLRDTEAIRDQPGWVWDHFQKTPPMATYAVAFTVCDYESTMLNNSSLGTVFKVWAPKHELPNTKYALEMGSKVFKYYQDYFGVKYPLPKLDFIIIPHIPGTMTENWGLISFNYVDFLVNLTETNRVNKETAVHLICQALPHQWLGDMVTMPWWGDAWLKESFAKMMTRLGMNSVAPEWNALENYPSANVRNVLLGDSLKTTRSLYTTITDPLEFVDVMDSIVGGKGGAVLRMLKYAIKDEVFRSGMRTYLETWKYKNVGAAELWNALDESAIELESTLPIEITVKAMMESWTLQPGYPVINVVRDYKTGNVEIDQQKFTETNGTDLSLWYIPLNYATSETVNLSQAITPLLWLKQEKGLIVENITKPGNTSWVLFNVFQIALYRVNYDETNWKLLTKLIQQNPEKIYAINRAQLIDDAFEMAKLGYLNYTVPLELTKYLHLKERSPLTWSAVFRSFLDLRNMLGTTPYSGIIQKYFLTIIEPLYVNLGTKERPQDSDDLKMLRTIVINHACLFRYQPCLNWAKTQFDIWTDDNDTNNEVIGEGHKYAIQCMAIQVGGEKEWDIVWDKTKNSSRSDLETIFMSLGCARDAWIITRYLERSLNGLVPSHYIPVVWKSLTFESRDHGFKFLRANWDRISGTYKNNVLIMKSIVEFLTQLSTEVDLTDLTTFYKDNKKDLNKLSILLLDAVDKIKLKINWTNTRMNTVITWLKENYGT